MSTHTYYNKSTVFGKIQVLTAFSPAKGEVGSNHVYVKMENGICPQLGTHDYGIFWPDDRVVTVSVPKHMLDKFRR